jgi:hypothetical protein
VLAMREGACAGLPEQNSGSWRELALQLATLAQPPQPAPAATGSPPPHPGPLSSEEGVRSAQTMRADPMILIAAQNNTARTDCNWSNFWANAASFSQNLTWQRPRPLGPGPSRCCGGIRAWPHRLCSGCAVVCCRVYRAKCLRRKPSIEPLLRQLRRLRLPLWRLLQLLMLWLRPLLLPLPLILAIVVLPCVAIAVSSRGQRW